MYSISDFTYQQIRIIYAQVQNQSNSNSNSNDSTGNQGEGFNPTKKITMILENTEIEIAPGEKVKTRSINVTVT
jgi:hypothetical protein